MARIPTYTSRAGLDTGRGTIPNVTVNTAPFAATVNLGESLSGLGGQLNRIAERAREREEKQNEFILQQKYLQLQETLQADYTEIEQNISPDGRGLLQSGLGAFEKRANEFLSQVPEGPMRERWVERLNTLRLDQTNNLALAEHNRWNTFQDRETGSMLDRLATTIATYGEGALEDTLRNGEQIIDSTTLDPLRKDELKRQWRQNAQIAALQSLPPEEIKRRLGESLGIDVPAVTGSVVDRIVGAESGGNATAKNPFSSATGAGQFIDSTWLDMVRRHRPDLAAGKSDAQILALRTDPDLSREMVGRYAEENAAKLRAAGFQPTAGNIYLAHFLGPQGAIDMLRAAPNALAKNINPAAAKSNPSIFSRHGVPKTAAQVIAWAEKKMGGTMSPSEARRPISDPDPRYRDIPLDKRLEIIESANQQMQADLTNSTQNILAAMLSFGPDSPDIPPSPSRESFLSAWGPNEGQRRWDEFERGVDLAQRRFAFRQQTPEEIAASLEALKPQPGITPADQIADQAKTYATAVEAAQTELSARAKDPASYAQEASPEVAQAWEVYQQSPSPEAYQAALAASAAYQTRIGIPPLEQRYLPQAVAKSVVDAFENEAASLDDRLTPLIQAVLTTQDRTQQQAIWEQLVSAGVPEYAEGAIEAMKRGDEGAARRLFEAAMVDPAKLPGRLPDNVRPVDIDDAIRDEIMADGKIGDVVYGFSLGVATNAVRPLRDATLMKRAVELRVRRGENLGDAVAGVARDMFGNITPVDKSLNLPGTGSVLAAVPPDTDIDMFLAGVTASMPLFKQALRESFRPPEDAPTADSTKAVLEATTENRIDNILVNGVIRNINGGYGLMDPYTGAFVAGADGQPIVLSLDNVLARGAEILGGLREGRMPFAREADPFVGGAVRDPFLMQDSITDSILGRQPQAQVQPRRSSSLPNFGPLSGEVHLNPGLETGGLPRAAPGPGLAASTQVLQEELNAQREDLLNRIRSSMFQGTVTREQAIQMLERAGIDPARLLGQ